MTRTLVTIKAEPCLTVKAIERLEDLVLGAEVFEFGSGGSTLWLASRAARVVSIEDNADWYKLVVRKLHQRGLPADARLVPTLLVPDAIEGTGMWDVVFVDCWTQNERRRAILRGRTHVKPGGWLVADDYDFPKVKQGIAKLTEEGWGVEIIAGTKPHPVRRVTVHTSTAFCHKTEGAR